MNMKENSMKRRKYKGMKMIPIKGLGIRNNTKTYINGSAVRKEVSPWFQWASFGTTGMTVVVCKFFLMWGQRGCISSKILSRPHQRFSYHGGANDSCNKQSSYYLSGGWTICPVYVTFFTKKIGLRNAYYTCKMKRRQLWIKIKQKEKNMSGWEWPPLKG